MSRHTYSQSAQVPAAVPPERVERIRTALRAAAGEFAEAIELSVEKLEERIAPGLSATN
jgi:hypothetical protein